MSRRSAHVRTLVVKISVKVGVSNGLWRSSARAYTCVTVHTMYLRASRRVERGSQLTATITSTLYDELRIVASDNVIRMFFYCPLKSIFHVDVENTRFELA